MKTTTAIALLVAMVGCMTTTTRGPLIRDRLSETPGLATHNISIDEGSPGFIVLSGNVSSQKDRITIEKVARETRGVRELRNNLIVDSSSIAVTDGYSSLNNDQEHFLGAFFGATLFQNLSPSVRIMSKLFVLDRII